MGYFRFDPVRSFEHLARKMSDITGEMEKGVSFEFGNFTPRIDISEDEKGLYLFVELPGLSKEDVKITINEDKVLLIKGSKRRINEIDGKSFIRAERCFGDFNRSFILPDNINHDSINAKFENGVLAISLQKIEPVKPKEVEINIG